MSNLENQRALDREDVNNTINRLRQVMKDIREMKPLLARAMTKEDLPQEFISPSTPVIGGLDPTDPNFTGSFVSGRGRTFSVGGTDKVINIGGVKAGVLQFGGSQEDGSFCAGEGAVCLDAAGITIDAGTDPLNPDDKNTLDFVALDGRLEIYMYDGGLTGIPAGYIRSISDPDISNALSISSESTGAGASSILLSAQSGIGPSTVSEIVLSNNGVTVNPQGLDSDTIIEGDTDANLVFVDASTDRVGIGTNSPAAKLDVNGDVAADGVLFDTAYSITGSEPTGSVHWNSDDETFDGVLPDDVIGQLFLEEFFDYTNQTGATITNGTPLMFSGTLGASGRILVQKAIADGTLKPEYIVGIATHDTDNGDQGKSTWRGKVRKIQTDGANYGETWADGDLIWVSPYTAGYLTNIEPPAPYRKILIAAVIKADATNGTLLVRPTWTPKMQEIDDVDGRAPVTGDVLVYNGSTWQSSLPILYDGIHVSFDDDLVYF